MIFKNVAEARRILGVWKKRLRLEDWDFVVQLVRDRDMAAPGRAGECGVDRDQNLVTINLLDPRDYGTRIYPQDHEKTLVHELLHVELDWFDDYRPGEDDPRRGAWNSSLESTINRMAETLVTSYRTKT